MPLTSRMFSYRNQYPISIPSGIYNKNGRVFQITDDMTEEDLAVYDLRIAPDRPAHNTENQKLEWDSDNFQWLVVDFTAEELQSLVDAKWHAVREERDTLLKSTDLTALIMMEKDGAVSQDLKNYRQALRDAPSNFDDPDDVVFPDLPAGVTLIDNDGTI